MFELPEIDLPYIAIIPYHIQADDNIPDSTKIYFGQMSALCQKYGYCFATDEQLAKMKGTSIENIKRWNGLLEKSGYIYRETKNVPLKKDGEKLKWRKKRKIFVNDAFARQKPKPREVLSDENEQDEDSNNVCERVIIDTSIEGVKNDTSIEGVKNDTYNSKLQDEIYKEQPEALSAIVVSLESLDISRNLKLKISKEYSPEKIDLAVERALNWKTRPTDEVGIMTTLRRADTWQDNPTPEQKEQSNLEYLLTLKYLDQTSIGVMKIIVGTDYIEFSAGMRCDCFRVEDVDFRKNITEYIEMLHRKKDKK